METWHFTFSTHTVGMRGKLPLFIRSFLQNRTFRVRVSTTLSRLFLQEEGVPQGSVLSVTLFGMAINDIAKSLPRDMGMTSLYHMLLPALI